MKKATNAATLSTEVQTPAVAPDVAITETTVSLMPPVLHLYGAMPLVLAEMVIHARLGYVFDVNTSVVEVREAGTMGFSMRLGAPDDDIVKVAQATITQATAVQRAQYEVDVQVAAKQLMEDTARAAKEAEVAAQIAETQAQIKRLQDSLKA